MNTQEKEVVVATQAQEVMSWEDAVKAKAAQQAAQQAAMSTSTKFISFSGGKLSYNKLPIPSNELEVIVLTFAGENAWYKGKFDPTQTQTPVCWSVYTEAGAMVPDSHCSEMQAENCVECPKFQWGSDPMGGRGKACKTRYRISVIPATVSSNADVAGAELAFAVLPVTSCADFDRFMAACQMTLNRPIFGVVSKLYVVPDAKTQYKVHLEPVRPVSGELMLAVLKRVEDAEKAILYSFEDEDASSEAAEAPKPLKK